MYFIYPFNHWICFYQFSHLDNQTYCYLMSGLIFLKKLGHICQFLSFQNRGKLNNWLHFWLLNCFLRPVDSLICRISFRFFFYFILEIFTSNSPVWGFLPLLHWWESPDFQVDSHISLECQNTSNLYYVETVFSNHFLCVCIIYFLISVALSFQKSIASFLIGKQLISGWQALNQHVLGSKHSNSLLKTGW